MPTSRVLTYPILPLGAMCDNALDEITYGQLASYGCLLLQIKQKKKKKETHTTERELAYSTHHGENGANKETPVDPL